MNSFWFTPRPKEVEHHHPFLVFDGTDRLHLPLTIFAHDASRRLSPKTVQTYLHAMLPFFTWLDTDAWQVRVGVTWDAPPRQIRQAVEDYLVSKLRCKVQLHQQGWRLVSLTTGTRSSLQIFLSALKLFYQIMATRGRYPFLNPLLEPVSASAASVEARLVQEDETPRMPDRSGVATPEQKPGHRLSDQYFRLKHEEWIPQILDDPKFPALILEGGKQLPLKYTRKRDEVLTWLLFETGARDRPHARRLGQPWDAHQSQSIQQGEFRQAHESLELSPGHGGPAQAVLRRGAHSLRSERLHARRLPATSRSHTR
jgi:hypothetical protein